MPLTRYLGYSIALQHTGNGQYKVNVTRPLDFSNISDKIFSLEKSEEAIGSAGALLFETLRERAIAHGKELIDFEVSPLLPF
jgi:hypothetical protein